MRGVCAMSVPIEREGKGNGRRGGIGYREGVGGLRRGMIVGLQQDQ